MSRCHNTGTILDCGDQFADNVPTLDPSFARQRMKVYLSQMAALHPDREHPSIEFVDALCEDRDVVKDQDTGAMDVCTGESAMEQVQASIKSLELSVQSQFSQIQSQLAV